MTTPWTSPPAPDDAPFPRGARFDHVVVGAGLTGLTTALLLARRGRSVVVLEADRIGALASGHNTGKLSLLQGTRYQQVRRLNTDEVFRAHVDSQRAGFAWVAAYLAEHDIPHHRLPAVTYAETPDQVDAVRREHDACRAAGLPVRMAPTASLPEPGHAAVVLDDQIQLDPMDLLLALAAEFRLLGGTILEHARVTRIRVGAPAVAHTAKGEVHGATIVLATGAPPLDRGLYWAKTEAKRSHLVAFRTPGDDASAAAGMFLGAGESPHSIRRHDGLLLVGGEGHGVGRQDADADPYAALAAWTRERWPHAEPVHAWSAQDYAPASGVPFVGWMPHTRRRAYLATGYEKWGLASAVASALMLEADLTDGRTEHWQKVLARRPTLPAALGRAAGAGAAVGVWYARGWVQAIREGLRRTGSPLPVAPVPDSAIDAEVCLVCPHLGAIVRWNDAERTWDCPAHGSRFRADGALIEGPAMRGLARR